MAHVYDLLMEDAPYDNWIQFTKRMVQKYKPDTHHILDVGCGTGEITHRLSNEGFLMTGLDLSSDMLTVAQQKHPKSNIQWLQQDMTSLNGLRGYDCIVSYCDVVNYLVDDDDVLSAFQSIYEALNEGGLFLFDVHSIDHIHNDLSGGTFAEVRDELSYIWFCDPGVRENSVVHDLTFFIKEQEKYKRFDEIHEQRGYDLDTLESWLTTAGFHVQDVYADFSEAPSLEGDRWMFICKK
ncbi:class I SAM-dependent DNA methyltransferase [Halobacillus karajensis]|uniref:dTDP-3-amino-3,4, 6-trideoxy-alpha-D-glucopyranose n=1 Tax=Halobacillus karajensis TaxID=195088 RepID=A0A024P6A5_9BACI|nr:class I SAM-dependent methyltransferase [Halobacillus karajensis]CDQ18064.1 dTDP-3-amino-3,4, 6-trideoxy-alpha-D-glucopyranose [Halobacillus karajensis]CDQ24415.1 dTDP-3-amino-3,4, 6-trideoxy-alpha-D-glucopyranose [Halobacillus karajensis]CDQ29337.1 dTDP-3-amino-3,4, 6-trideoxy-alpha-D-glucopyranose [Halobacillus karajensis]